MVNRFILNEVSYFGPGARKELPGVVKSMGFKKALVVTDKGLMKFGVAQRVIDELDSAGIPYEIFDEVKPNPTVTNVKDGIAETTINYVIIDEANHKKMVCVDPHDIPVCAIVDAELMYSLPKSLTAATGMDAMTHAIEGLITKGAWEMSDMFEIKAIEMIYKYLPIAVQEPSNPEGRNGMAVAQYIAGMAFSNVGLGVDHGMAHPLSALHDVPHGVACAMLLPVVMRFNAPAAKEKYAEIAKACGVYETGMTTDQAVEAACKAIEDLSKLVGIPQHLSELGIKEEDIQALADQAIADVCTPGNPREVTRDDIVAIYKQIL